MKWKSTEKKDALCTFNKNSVEVKQNRNDRGRFMTNYIVCCEGGEIYLSSSTFPHKALTVKEPFCVGTFSHVVFSLPVSHRGTFRIKRAYLSH